MRKSPSLISTDILPYKIEEAVHYIERNYSKLLTLEVLSTHLRIEKHQLSRIFRKRVGVTPLVYLNNLRITISKELLTDKNRRIREVARRVGIPPNLFSQWFKSKTGMTPEEYRQLSGQETVRVSSPSKAETKGR